MILYRSKANIIGAFIVSVIGGLFIYLLHDKADAKFYLAGIGAAAGIVWGWVMSIEMGGALPLLRYVDLIAGVLSGIVLGMNLVHPVSDGWSYPLWCYPASALITTNFLTMGLFGLLAKRS